MLEGPLEQRVWPSGRTRLQLQGLGGLLHHWAMAAQRFPFSQLMFGSLGIDRAQDVAQFLAVLVLSGDGAGQ